MKEVPLSFYERHTMVRRSSKKLTIDSALPQRRVGVEGVELEVYLLVDQRLVLLVVALVDLIILGHFCSL